MRVLITGSTGFVGRHLVRALLRRSHEVIAVSRQDVNWMLHNVTSVRADLLDASAPGRLLLSCSPDAVVHLAAQSNVKRSWDHPTDTFTVNTVGAVHWLSAILAHRPSTKLLSIGSGEEYGLAGNAGRPLTEDDPCQPQNPYAISKYATGQLLLQLARRDGLAMCHLRAFNHFGPGQPEGFAISDFAAQIARIERGLAAPLLRTGALSARRDFTDVRDVVRAYIRFLEADVPTGIYNICSGIPRSIGDALKLLTAGASVRVDVEPDPERLRPSEVPLLVGSPEKAAKAIGWAPERDFEASVIETLDWWRGAVSNETAVRASGG